MSKKYNVFIDTNALTKPKSPNYAVKNAFDTIIHILESPSVESVNLVEYQIDEYVKQILEIVSDEHDFSKIKNKFSEYIHIKNYNIIEYNLNQVDYDDIFSMAINGDAPFEKRKKVNEEGKNSDKGFKDAVIMRSIKKTQLPYIIVLTDDKLCQEYLKLNKLCYKGINSDICFHLNIYFRQMFEQELNSTYNIPEFNVEPEKVYLVFEQSVEVPSTLTKDSIQLYTNIRSDYYVDYENNLITKKKNKYGKFIGYDWSVNEVFFRINPVNDTIQRSDFRSNMETTFNEYFHYMIIEGVYCEINGTLSLPGYKIK